MCWRCDIDILEIIAAGISSKAEAFDIYYFTGIFKPKATTFFRLRKLLRTLLFYTFAFDFKRQSFSHLLRPLKDYFHLSEKKAFTLTPQFAIIKIITTRMS